jgi:hypothetical protein
MTCRICFVFNGLLAYVEPQVDCPEHRVNCTFTLTQVQKHTHPSILLSSHRVHTDWQWPISGVHSILMEKSALPGEGGGYPPYP